MKTYFIVEHNDRSGKSWRAHKRGIRTMFSIYNVMNEVLSTNSWSSADNCEEKLRRKIKKPRVIKVVRLPTHHCT